MSILFRALSCLPLWALHALGAGMGWMAYVLSAVYRQRLNLHADLAGLSQGQRRQSIAAAGQMVGELPLLWFGGGVPVQWDGSEWIDAALATDRGLLFLTPHLGCFEVTAQAYALRYGIAQRPMTVLYRPARKVWLRSLVEHARQRPGLATAPATLAGVKQMLKALRAGGAVGLLPDQVPPKGLGVWAQFFGRPAYTMTLPARLAEQTGATVLMAWGERLPWGRGYVVHVRPMPMVQDAGPVVAAQQINAAMEALIREQPGQYLWGYDRYKPPREGRV